MANVFREDNFIKLCDKVIRIDSRLRQVTNAFGYPPFWHRPPTFETLILTILEQQVSLAAAAAAYNKLEIKTGKVTPENILCLTGQELSECYFSRQKIIYARHLASEIVNGNLNLKILNTKSAIEIRNELTKIKGIGDWTVDTYLLMSLHHADIFPVGDLATVKSMKELNLVKPDSSKEELISYMKHFSPYRSIATYLLWHSYIRKRGLKL